MHDNRVGRDAANVLWNAKDDPEVPELGIASADDVLVNAFKNNAPDKTPDGMGETDRASSCS